MKRTDLPELLYDVIKKINGKAEMIDIFKKFWETYEEELSNSGDLFYTWNYDIRWAATCLRQNNRMKPAEVSPKGFWEIIL